MDTKHVSISKVEAVVYDEPGEGLFVYGVLSSDIDGKAFLEALNAKIEPFNADVDLFHEKEKELNILHGLNLTREEICGESFLNEREPKYPAKTPEGFKSVLEACPEITLERNRRKIHNQRLEGIYQIHRQKAQEKFDNDILPFKEELLKKWPEFKRDINSYFSYNMRIYYPFSLTTFNEIIKI